MQRNDIEGPYGIKLSTSLIFKYLNYESIKNLQVWIEEATPRYISQVKGYWKCVFNIGNDK